MRDKTKTKEYWIVKRNLLWIYYIDGLREPTPFHWELNKIFGRFFYPKIYDIKVSNLLKENK